MTDLLPEDMFEARPLNKAAVRAQRRAAAKNQPASDRRQRAGDQPGAKPLEAKTAKQAEYIAHLQAGKSVAATGGAGTGKTYVAARVGARGLIEGRFEKIVLCRVAVSKPKHAMGFLPGKIEDKLKPWLVPVIDGLRAEVSAGTLDEWKAKGMFEVVAFEHMRGRTFSNAFVILDEAQNADFGDLKLFLTRTGANSQIVLTGDMDQIDIPNSGLSEVIDMILDYDVPVEVVQFTSADVVRSALAKAFVQAFERHAATKKALADGQRHDPPNGAFLDRAPAFLNNGVSAQRLAA
ncbi:PhoH-like phosphate starvation-inducible [Caulobacter phage CcrBL9]|uniref:PhoH-like protein n=1 Tax=Caulobacter phage CcrBL9 TaxID=2283270 RepID=A0A385EEA5_9CAUD|nr:PhoH-like phosphate starvation-inducible [Caulobacter phage CcrBL9]AXQ69182.1 phosphate starvation-inducible protein [Caulobacter phage CcrBL9]